MSAIARYYRRWQKVSEEIWYWKANTYPDPKAPGFKDTSGLDLPKGVRIPDWKKFKVEDHQDYAMVQRWLAEDGLKNPWLRNEVWRPRKYYGFDAFAFYTQWAWDFCKYGIGLFVVYVAYDKLTHSEDDEHGHGHDHDDKYPLLYELKQKESTHH